MTLNNKKECAKCEKKCECLNILKEYSSICPCHISEGGFGNFKACVERKLDEYAKNAKENFKNEWTTKIKRMIRADEPCGASTGFGAALLEREIEVNNSLVIDILIALKKNE